MKSRQILDQRLDFKKMPKQNIKKKKFTKYRKLMNSRQILDQRPDLRKKRDAEARERER